MCSSFEKDALAGSNSRNWDGREELGELRVIQSRTSRKRPLRMSSTGGGSKYSDFTWKRDVVATGGSTVFRGTEFVCSAVMKF